MGRSTGHKTDGRRSLTSGTTEQQRQLGQNKPTSSALEVELKLVWDQANRQSVALKTFRTDPSAYRPCSSCNLVKYEAKSMVRVTPHNNIVRLIKVEVKSPSNVCLVMEAAAASRGNLMKTIAAAPNSKLRPDTARFYLGQLLDAVEHCHLKGVCHRDIQPHNLLVDPRSGNLKLSNFGRAGLFNPTTGGPTDHAYAPGAALLAHAAPEVLEGSRYCGKAADCWSVGATLFTMLTGFRHFTIDDPFAIEDGKVGDYDRYVQFPPWICPLARSLLEGIMEPDAERRLTIAQIRSHPWFLLKRGASGSSNRDRGSSPSPSSTSTSTSSYSVSSVSSSSSSSSSSNSSSSSRSFTSTSVNTNTSDSVECCTPSDTHSSSGGFHDRDSPK